MQKVGFMLSLIVFLSMTTIAQAEELPLEEIWTVEFDTTASIISSYWQSDGITKFSIDLSNRNVVVSNAEIIWENQELACSLKGINFGSGQGDELFGLSQVVDRNTPSGEITHHYLNHVWGNIRGNEFCEASTTEIGVSFWDEESWGWVGYYPYFMFCFPTTIPSEDRVLCFLETFHYIYQYPNTLDFIYTNRNRSYSVSLSDTSWSERYNLGNVNTWEYFDVDLDGYDDVLTASWIGRDSTHGLHETVWSSRDAYLTTFNSNMEILEQNHYEDYEGPIERLILIFTSFCQYTYPDGERVVFGSGFDSVGTSIFKISLPDLTIEERYDFPEGRNPDMRLFPIHSEEDGIDGIIIENIDGAIDIFDPYREQFVPSEYIFPTYVGEYIVKDFDGNGTIELAMLHESSFTLYRLNPISRAISEVNSNTPSILSLSVPHPNPFNAVTRLTYGLPMAGRVNLSIYDIHGREIATLFSGEQVAGTHSVTWNAEGAPSGVYFCRLTTATQSHSQKVVLVR